ncbi:hypothetical protein MTE2_5013 [Klebsiella pneumoniae VA360]|nr:hypothetical protein MTE2_5013 [Klebsiella pneumoniae VA360]EYB80301.1 hypothetical protein KPB1_5468 [Klebsiella pneumoniae Kb140]
MVGNHPFCKGNIWIRGHHSCHHVVMHTFHTRHQLLRSWRHGMVIAHRHGFVNRKNSNRRH